ncbi:helix-turn-helix domain-containing protein [Allomuricauda sp. AC10]|uniref:helix-turn-helix domain-containing protein n=1 Tax=Flavobacteriaceae TaxID=49546 RepID=UPI0023494199|nr:helix-turn-helix domain-containing protein [Muricauda sp. AC10]MDC6365497.1 helix-turn-helix domain-containing protein [Muricauda sp. AC10]
MRYNLASHIMFLGIVQTYFLGMVIFVRSKKNSAIRIFGWSLFFQALVCTDTYLCYTGLIKYLIQFNDSTEVFVLMIAPTIYFFVYALLERKPITFKKHWIHFLVPLLYLVSQIGYFLNPISVKLNAYLDAYHDDIPMVSVPDWVTYKYQFIKDEFRWIMLASFTFYLVLSGIIVYRKKKQKKLPTQKVKIDKYAFTRNTVLLLILLLAMVFIIYLNYEDDGGDHFIVIFVAAIAFMSSFFVLSESRFFENSWIADRYETLTSDSLSFEDIDAYVEDNTYFLVQNSSLKDLSEKLETSTNTLSKSINSETGLNFNDYLNQKRVSTAKERLLDPAFSNLTIEAIGKSVGFSSKSAFYNAFKKHTGHSPSIFLKQKN